MFIAMLFLAGCLGVALLYIGLTLEEGKQATELLIAGLGLTQLLTMVQMLGVLRRFEINWREPFNSVLTFLEIMSFDVEPGHQMVLSHRHIA